MRCIIILERFYEIIIPAIIGSSGIVGLLFYVLSKSLDKKFSEQEERRKKSHELQIKRDELENKKSCCYGKLFFWMYKYITDNNYWKELDQAFEELQKVEEEIKEFERRRLAELLNDDCY